MKIVVCIKQVPDTKGGVSLILMVHLTEAAMLTIMNPDDKAGLEAALRLKRSVWRRSNCCDNGTSKGRRSSSRGNGDGR